MYIIGIFFVQLIGMETYEYTYENIINLEKLLLLNVYNTFLTRKDY